MSEFPSCSCGGLNENCNLCYGTGIARPKNTTGKVGLDERNRIIQHMSRVAVICPYCQLRGLQPAIKAHIAKAHLKTGKRRDAQARQELEAWIAAAIAAVKKKREVKKAAKQLKKQKSKKTKQLKGREQLKLNKQTYVAKSLVNKEAPLESRKTILDSSLRKSLIERGLLRPISTKLINQTAKVQQQAFSMPPTTVRELVPCPICKARIKPTKLAKHVKTVHHLVDQRMKLQQHNRAGQATNSEEVESHSEQIRSVPDYDPRDAHRGVGFVIREEGRYGSHALHDRFDDESEP
ncbi:MAG: hypothetical protein ABSD13_00165 [Candidatus Korobacteraceae bacterium]